MSRRRHSAGRGEKLSFRRRHLPPPSRPAAQRLHRHRVPPSRRSLRLRRALQGQLSRQPSPRRFLAELRVQSLSRKTERERILPRKHPPRWSDLPTEKGRVCRDAKRARWQIAGRPPRPPLPVLPIPRRHRCSASGAPPPARPSARPELALPASGRPKQRRPFRRQFAGRRSRAEKSPEMEGGGFSWSGGIDAHDDGHGHAFRRRIWQLQAVQNFPLQGLVDLGVAG